MGPNMPLLKCRRTDTLHRALELLAAAGDKFERLLCVDEAGACVGVLTISDIFGYFCSSGGVEWVTAGHPEYASVVLSGGRGGEGGEGGMEAAEDSESGMASRTDSSVGLALG